MIQKKKQLSTDPKEIIRMLSVRIRELRELVCAKKQYVLKLQNKALGPWQDSKLAPIISYIKTMIAKCISCITKILNCIDDIGLHVANLNGDGENYKVGRGIAVDLSTQVNYICLRNSVDSNVGEAASLELKPAHIKQKSKAWDSLHSGAVVTGSTMYKGLGIEKLKDKKALW